jgi:hypothetical protein
MCALAACSVAAAPATGYHSERRRACTVALLANIRLLEGVAAATVPQLWCSCRCIDGFNVIPPCQLANDIFATAADGGMS